MRLLSGRTREFLRRCYLKFFPAEIAKAPVADSVSQVRPLFQISGHFPQGDIGADWVGAWLGSHVYRAEIAAFKDYPTTSLMSDEGRAFLYHLMRTYRPDVVVEIGTYHAGTAEVICRALHDNARGHLYTVDPFGADRCPQIISRWPQELSQCVTYLPVNSMALIQQLESQAAKVDIAFVDGCHEFEFALFDLLAMAKHMAPGGIVVLDNAEQPGVFRACAEFLRMNGSWVELGNAMASATKGNPFAYNHDRTSVPDTSFLLLKAPEILAIEQEAVFTSGQIDFPSTSVRGFCIEMLDGKDKGVLYSEVCLRGFGPPVPIEIKALSSTRIENGQAGTPINVSLEAPLDLLLLEGAKEIQKRTCEISLSWVSDDHTPSASLKLRRQPQVF